MESFQIKTAVMVNQEKLVGENDAKDLPWSEQSSPTWSSRSSSSSCYDWDLVNDLEGMMEDRWGDLDNNYFPHPSSQVSSIPEPHWGLKSSPCLRHSSTSFLRDLVKISKTVAQWNPPPVRMVCHDPACRSYLGIVGRLDEHRVFTVMSLEGVKEAYCARLCYWRRRSRQALWVEGSPMNANLNWQHVPSYGNE